MSIIFYSWQSDLEKSSHKNYIEKCIKNAIKRINKESSISIYMDYDRDTLGLMGSPDISSVIFEKIDKCKLFVADVSVIIKDEKRAFSNPNVLIELGYAASVLGWNRIICFYDINMCSPEDLPFDIRQKRVTGFDPNDNDCGNYVSGIIYENIKTLYYEGKLENPLERYMKKKITNNILKLAEKVANWIYGTVSCIDGKNDIEKLMNEKNIGERLKIAKIPDFYISDDLYEVTNEFRNIVRELFSANYYSKDWIVLNISLLEWLEYHSSIWNINSEIFERTGEDYIYKYNVSSASSLDLNNDRFSGAVYSVYLKDGKSYIDTINGPLAYVHGIANMSEYEKIYYKISQDKNSIVCSHISKFVTMLHEWNSLSDCEIDNSL